jgi:glycine/D-amino acid oxidase-like deaminating enzyme
MKNQTTNHDVKETKIITAPLEMSPAVLNSGGLIPAGFGNFLFPGVSNPLATFFPFGIKVKQWVKPNISRDHIIRVTVGLRPHRPSGFVVRSESLGSKTLVHNYGHGGSGWSLSWGTASLVADEVQKTSAKKIAVMGSGINGLTTARLLQRYGYEVVIYTKDMPPNVTSNFAGAGWSPTATLVDEGKYTPEFKKLLTKTARISHRFFQDFIGIERYGVEYQEGYAADDAPPVAHGADYIGSDIEDLVGETEDMAEGTTPFQYKHVTKHWSMRYQVPRYLAAMQDDFRIAGGMVITKEFKRPEDIDALPEMVVVNCMGLGTKEVFNDPELMPIRGQLTHLIPQPELTYRFGVASAGLNFNPRGDALSCGGSTIPNIWDSTPDPHEVDRVIDGLISNVETRFKLS